MTLPQQLQLASEHYRAGRLTEARNIYQSVLAEQPNHPQILFLLGVISQQLGQIDGAIDYLQAAISARPDFAQAHCNLGVLFASRNQFDEAIAAFRRAVQLQADFADAHFNLGAALSDANQPDEAIHAYQQAIRINPGFAEAHYELGNALAKQRQLSEAISAYRRAIQYKPNFAEAYCNLATALCECGEIAESIAASTKAIAIAPGNPAAHSNVADTLRRNGQFDQAISACRQAMQIDPDFADSYINLAAVFRDQGKLNDAITACRQAIDHKSNFAIAYANLSDLLREKHRLDEAERNAKQALAIDPNSVAANKNLANIYKDQGRMTQAAASFRRVIELRPDLANMHGSLVFATNYCCEYDSAKILAEAKAWADRHERPLQSEIQPLDVDRSPTRCLRIGYVSADLRDHPVGRSLLPLLMHHDREQYQIICYSNSAQQDGVTDRLRAKSDVWRNIIGISDRQLAEQIRRDKIDILVDLSLHTGGNRLLAFARKPAPLQITWLGYPGTTGMKNMDYRLTDPYLDPQGKFDDAYSEKSIRLPRTFWCFDAELMNAANIPPVGPLPAMSNGYVTFGCLNNFCKINQPLLNLWNQVLDAVPSSRLLLLAAEGSIREWVAKTLRDRVNFVPHAPRSEYLRYYHRIDIGLDTFPYGGHTTSFDSFWMGVPVVSLIGETVVGRAGLSLLSTLELSELAATTPEQFVATAARLASDLRRLDDLRKTMRDLALASPLMNGKEFARGIELVYQNLWQRWTED